MPTDALDTLRRALHAHAVKADAQFLQRFFKTGPGEYAEGDVFIGVRVPQIRALSRQGDELELTDLAVLLRSPIHEERLLALVMLVRRFERRNSPVRREVYELYLRERRHINNWDLVDLSAPNIVGGWLLDHPREILDELVASPTLWDRRIAVLATFTLLRAGQFDDTLRLCTRLLRDPEDLMHKACGWMLREVGKRDLAPLRAFLARHAGDMPRTMLRYSLEKLDAAERTKWMSA